MKKRLKTRRWIVRKFFVIFIALLLTTVCISTAYADKAVEAAEAKFREARRAYIGAKEELSDAQIESLRTIGKTEKQEAKKNVWGAHRKVKRTKKAYKEALKVLHEAEMARDAKIDRSPWK